MISVPTFSWKRENETEKQQILSGNCSRSLWGDGSHHGPGCGGAEWGRHVPWAFHTGAPGCVRPPATSPLPPGLTRRHGRRVRAGSVPGRFFRAQGRRRPTPRLHGGFPRHQRSGRPSVSSSLPPLCDRPAGWSVPVPRPPRLATRGRWPPRSPPHAVREHRLRLSRPVGGWVGMNTTPPGSRPPPEDPHTQAGGPEDLGVPLRSRDTEVPSHSSQDDVTRQCAVVT